ncbi:hypothetical protein [Streptomyces sp. NBC_00847]|uniref:hypothetical protein n=1 Tax=unclassified Streptomyces TaxID=2593676 RepID=UPI002258112A|nr:hypothetical protein [Streptomyces sp. NBC_00847]MCX4882802.1 hypothetical protein [Streptomyces sp. NBC_00847]
MLDGGGGGGDSVFSGIDPDALKATIESVRRDQETLQDRSSYYKTQLAYYGIGTAELNEVLKVASWARDELPILTRRYHLALACDEPYPGAPKGTAMVSINEAMVGQKTAAERNGKALAEQFKKDFNGSNSAELFAALEANADDADYIKAFYKTLGPDKLVWLSNEMADDPYDDYYDKHPDALTHDRNLVARTLGTFTQVAFDGQTAKEKQAAWSKWFDKFAMDPQRGFRPDRLMPLLAGGRHDKDFLVALGDRVFSKDQKTFENEWMNSSGKGPWEADHYTQLFNAIASNPEASGEWMSHDYETIQTMVYNPAGSWDKSRSAALVKVLHSATIDLRPTNEALAEKLTAHLMFDNYKHMNGDEKDIHPIEGVDYFYSQLVTSYWKDLENGVTSPVADKFWMGDATTGGFTEKASKWDEKAFLNSQDPSRFGLEAGAPMWQALMNESARDPKAAGELSALFDTYRNQNDAQVVHMYRTDNAAIEYLSMKRGLMMKAYGTAFTSAKESHKTDAEAWAEGVNEFRKALIETAVDGAEAAATGGSTAVADMGREQLTGLGGSAKGLLTDWLAEQVSVKPEEAPGGLADKYKALSDAELDTSWRDNYRRLANQQLAADPGSGSKGGFDHSVTKPVTVGPVHKDHSTYTGNPLDKHHLYIRSQAENFLTPAGEVMDPHKMSPRQLAAYSRWLEDYAVVAAVQNSGFKAAQQFQNLPE